jgi:hypothetical protein
MALALKARGVLGGLRPVALRVGFWGRGGYAGRGILSRGFPFRQAWVAWLNPGRRERSPFKQTGSLSGPKTSGVPRPLNSA